MTDKEREFGESIGGFIPVPEYDSDPIENAINVYPDRMEEGDLIIKALSRGPRIGEIDHPEYDPMREDVDYGEL